MHADQTEPNKHLLRKVAEGRCTDARELIGTMASFTEIVRIRCEWWMELLKTAMTSNIYAIKQLCVHLFQ